jgi:queuosine precursor transporter
MVAKQSTESEMPVSFNTAQVLYVWLAGLFVTCLVIADVIGIKLFRIPLGFSFHLPGLDQPISAIEHSCGMLTFPVTFLLTDLLNEYYGPKAARRVTFIGLAMAMFVFVVLNIAQYMPHWDAPFNIAPEHFNAVFASAKVMYIASVTAYLVGQLCDIWVFHWLKKATRGKLLWLRATGSTIVSQTLDSFVVTYLAFNVGRRLFPDPNNLPVLGWQIVQIAVTGYMLKFVLAIALTPMIYASRGLIHRSFGLVPLPSDDPRS